jgi:hypothetical protein
MLQIAKSAHNKNTAQDLPAGNITFLGLKKGQNEEGALWQCTIYSICHSANLKLGTII